jgi:hypothetical protein
VAETQPQPSEVQDMRPPEFQAPPPVAATPSVESVPPTAELPATLPTQPTPPALQGQPVKPAKRTRRGRGKRGARRQGLTPGVPSPSQGGAGPVHGAAEDASPPPTAATPHPDTPEEST